MIGGSRAVGRCQHRRQVDVRAGEADNFRRTVLVAVDAAGRSFKGEPGPVAAETTRKITAALQHV